MRDTGLVRVLVVYDDEAVRSALTHALHRDGYDVSTAGDGAAALAELLRLRHDAVVLDVLMPEPGGLDWFDVTRLLATVGRHCKVVGADITEFGAMFAAGEESIAKNVIVSP